MMHPSPSWRKPRSTHAALPRQPHPPPTNSASSRLPSPKALRSRNREPSSSSSCCSLSVPTFSPERHSKPTNSSQVRQQQCVLPPVSSPVCPTHLSKPSCCAPLPAFSDFQPGNRAHVELLPRPACHEGEHPSSQPRRKCSRRPPAANCPVPPAHLHLS